MLPLLTDYKQIPDTMFGPVMTMKLLSSDAYWNQKETDYKFFTLLNTYTFLCWVWHHFNSISVIKCKPVTKKYPEEKRSKLYMII